MSELRARLAASLAWSSAHAALDQAVAHLPAEQRGMRPSGLPHSVWELVEHVRLAQADILSFCRDERYEEHRWPEDYWPAAPAPPDDAAWQASLEAYRRDLEALQAWVADPAVDLEAVVLNGTDQTALREVLLVLDHTAYHVGQIVLVRRLLGSWPPDEDGPA